MQKAYVNIKFYEPWKLISSKEPLEMNISVSVKNGVKGHVSKGEIYSVSKKKKKIVKTTGDVRSNNYTSRYIDKAAWEKLMDNDELASHFSV